MNIPKAVVIKEVGPRDGLQNENQFISTEAKIEWINQLSSTGLSYIEVTSFVNPKWIPQLKDATDVFRQINKQEQITYAALVPNMKGLESALRLPVDEVSVFMSASETHNVKNINKTIEATFPILQEVIEAAQKSGVSVRGYVSTAFGCPYEGKVNREQVVRVCETLMEYGLSELSIGDTIGVASPRQVAELLELLLPRFKKEKLALHFHDTRGMALANVLKALEYEITTFDSSLGGLGGCPYAPGASGNVATEDLVHMLLQMGIETGVDMKKLLHACRYIQEKMGKPLNSHQMAVCNASE